MSNSKPLGLLYTGDSLEILKTLPDESIQMCVTSPPYWGLRDYTVCQCRGGVDNNTNGQGASTLKSDGRDEESRLHSLEVTKTNPREPDPNCVKCSGTGRLIGLLSVWGGGVACSHAWCVELPHGSRGNRGESGTGGNQRVVGSGVGTSSAGNVCECGAWRGSLGNEPTPELFIEHLVMIFREVRRILRKDGTFWVNIGDTYYGGSGGYNPKYEKEDASAGPKSFGGTKDDPIRENQRQKRKSPPKRVDIKQKDLTGIPWMLAFALRADGWYLRQDIIWAKRNPMPESVTDRCVRSHEYVFLLSKSREYYFDHIAIREPALEYAKERRKISLGSKSLSKGQSAGANVNPSGNALVDEVALNPMRNKRSVWALSSKPFRGAHFATFPEDLVTMPILAGTSEHGACVGCRTPYDRIVEKESTGKTEPTGKNADLVAVGSRNDGNGSMGYATTTTGWRKTCECETDTAVPCVVLDPFSGAATTGKVALSLGREYIGIEANPDYQEIARQRLCDAGLDCEVI